MAIKKKNNPCIWLLLALSLAFTLQQEPFKEKDLIVWNETTKLTWDNFKGRADKSKNKAAATAYTVYCKYVDPTSKPFSLNIRACFIIKESWKKDRAPSDYLLDHEQRHFDIAEIYARTLRKKFTDAVFKNDAAAKKEIPKMMQENDRALSKYQDLYDKETNHSINKEQQEAWDKKIDADLKELENYTNNIIEIKIQS